MRLLLPLLLLILTGCAAMPELDTNQKRLLSAEISLQELSLFALNSKDRMGAETRERVKALINDAHAALKAARLALDVGNEVDFTNNITTANTLINALRPILIELEKEATSCLNCRTLSWRWTRSPQPSIPQTA